MISSELDKSDSPGTEDIFDYDDEHKKKWNEINKMYSSLPVVIEGPNYKQDLSYFLCHLSPDLTDLEKGITLKTLLELPDNLKPRFIDMEFRLL